MGECWKERVGERGGRALDRRRTFRTARCEEKAGRRRTSHRVGKQERRLPHHFLGEVGALLAPILEVVDAPGRQHARVRLVREPEAEEVDGKDRANFGKNGEVLAPVIAAPDRGVRGRQAGMLGRRMSSRGCGRAPVAAEAVNAEHRRPVLRSLRAGLLVPDLVASPRPVPVRATCQIDGTREVPCCPSLDHSGTHAKRMLFLRRAHLVSTAGGDLETPSATPAAAAMHCTASRADWTGLDETRCPRCRGSLLPPTRLGAAAWIACPRDLRWRTANSGGAARSVVLILLCYLSGSDEAKLERGCLFSLWQAGFLYNALSTCSECSDEMLVVSGFYK